MNNEIILSRNFTHKGETLTVIQDADQKPGPAGVIQVIAGTVVRELMGKEGTKCLTLQEISR
jgi:hypothetical protein